MLGVHDNQTKAVRKANPEGTQFLNVDLDIYARSDLQPLVTALGKKVFVLYAGFERRTHVAHLELARRTTTADATIRGFCSLIRGLRKAERGLWDAAKKREFNVGVQTELRPSTYEIQLRAETIKAVSEIGALVKFTVYAPQPRKAVRKLKAGTMPVQVD